MEDYKRVLVACDIGSDAEWVLKRAITVAKVNRAELYLLHVHEPIVIDPSYEFSPILTGEMDRELLSASEKAFQQLAARYQISQQNLIIEIGSATQGIMSVAARLGIDLLVVGSHGRHGIQLLLGSTANAVLHHASCDVLAVRIPDRQNTGAQ